MRLDSLRSSHPIQVPIHHAEEVESKSIEDDQQMGVGLVTDPWNEYTPEV